VPSDDDVTAPDPSPSPGSPTAARR
jgi:hypothetical protein